MLILDSLIIGDKYWLKSGAKLVKLRHIKKSAGGNTMCVFRALNSIDDIKLVPCALGLADIDAATAEQLAAASDLVEWTDPITKEKHTCPKQYVEKLLTNVQVGAHNATTAKKLLALMQEKPTDSNERHLRQAALYL